MGRAKDGLGVVAPSMMHEPIVLRWAESVLGQKLVPPEAIVFGDGRKHRLAAHDVGQRHPVPQVD
jgi:hypothetical protein